MLIWSEFLSTVRKHPDETKGTLILLWVSRLCLVGVLALVVFALGLRWIVDVSFAVILGLVFYCVVKTWVEK